MLVICVCLLASSLPLSAKAQGAWASPQNTFKSGNTGFSGWNSAGSNNAFSSSQNSGLGSWNLNAASNVQPVSAFDESYSNWDSDSYNGNGNNKPGFASSGSWESDGSRGGSSFGGNSRREYETALGKNTGRGTNRATTNKTPKKQQQSIGNAGNWQSDAFSANNEKKLASIMNPPTSSNSNQFSSNNNYDNSGFSSNSGFSDSANWASGSLNTNNLISDEILSSNDEDNSVDSWNSNSISNLKPTSGSSGWGSSGQNNKKPTSNNNSNKNSNNSNNWNTKPSSNNRPGGSATTKKPATSQSGSSSARDTSILDELDKNDWYFGKESNYPRPPFKSALNIDVSELWNLNRNRKSEQNFRGGSTSVTTNKRRRNRETGIQCECVDVDLCDEDDMITTKKDLNNDWRSLKEFQCQRLNQVCCTKPKAAQSNEIEEDSEPEVLGCGQRRFKQTFSNFGENVAQPGEFPWNLKIEDSESDANCSASLIHSKLVLTAAHCVDRCVPSTDICIMRTDPTRQAASLKVRAGLWNADNEPSQIRRVTSVILHPDYSSTNPRNDIALLVLDRPFKLTDNVNTVCLPLANDKWLTNGCFVAGWRPKEINGEVFEVLEKGIVGFLPQQECQTIMLITDLWRNYVLHDSFVCGVERNGRNACLGDEGSPLVCPSAKTPNTYLQIGIVSNSMNCDNFGRPGIFTNVLKFLDWINKHTFDLDLFDDMDFRTLL